MLKAVFVSRCSGNALPETRRILDAFASRIGEFTWQIPITEEGLATLRHALGRSARRNTAVSCHVLQRGRLRLRWIVGARRRFNPDGSVPTRSSLRGHPAFERSRQFSGLRMLLEVVEGAALGHDLGKSTIFFQNKLISVVPIADPVRHEVVSALLLPAVRDGQTIAAALQARTATAPALTVRRWIETVGPGTAAGRNFPVTLPSNANWKCQDVIAWLVATHHRLPADGPNATHHVNEAQKDGRPWTARQLSDNAQPKFDLLAIAAPAFRERVTAAVRTSNSEVLPVGLRDALYLWGRLALMLGDHRGSSIELPPGTSGLIANSTSTTAATNSRRAPQDLVEHLGAVARLAVRAGKRLTVLDELLPSLTPENMEGLTGDAVNRAFRWQNAAARAASIIGSEPEAKRRGAFVVLAGGTGSGKTRAAARIIATLAKGAPVRFTTLLGLRSLTLQTGDAYRQQLGIPAADLAVLIGSREVRALHDLVRNSNREPASAADTEIEVTVAGGATAEIPAIFRAECRRPDEQRLLASPVAVCTIDYLMAGADWRRGSHLLAQLRIASADLILDEFDGYDLSDYPALARLCYLAGMFGRRLLLSSATATPELVTPLYEAYAGGRSAYAALSGNSPDIDTLLAADLLRPAVHHTAAPSAFNEIYARFAASLARAARDSAERAPLRRGRVTDIRSIAALQSQIVALHADNAVALEDGVQLSVGLVRFARVRDAVWVALRLAASAESLPLTGTLVKVLPYHAFLPLAVRHHTEALLDGALQRHGRASDIATSELCRGALREARERGCRHLLVIVVATPVEEVGRDHDFDYAVIEPSSTRSIVQCAGRVNRHRRTPLRPGQVNIAVMRFNCRSLEQGDAAPRKRVFHSPGLEPQEPIFPSQDIAELAPETVTLPTAAPCLASRDEATVGKLAAWERAVVEQRLSADVRRGLLQTVMAKITDVHMAAHPFRGGSSSDNSLFFDLDDECWKQIDPDTGKAVARSFKRWDSDASNGWLLPAGTFNALNDQLAASLQIDDAQAYARRYLTVSTPIYVRERPESYYADPMLGVFSVRESVIE